MTKKEEKSGALKTVILCVTVLLIAITEREAKGQQTDIPTGVYEFVGGDEEARAHEGALERALLELNPLIRPIGRRALRRYLKIPSFIVIQSKRNKLSITLQHYPPRSSTIDGTPSTFTAVSGDSGTICRTIKGATIHEHIETGGNKRRLSYQFFNGHREMTVQWSTTVPRYFSKAIRFRLSYRRQLVDGAVH